MDSERPIEKLLRDSAKKRAAEAGESLSLHPATRRLLQGEVARVYGGVQNAPEPLRSSSWFFKQLWPSLGWSLTVLAGLALAGSLMLPQRAAKNYELAMADKTSAGKTSPSAVAATAQSSARQEPSITPNLLKETSADASGLQARRQVEPPPLLAYDAPGRKSKAESLGALESKDTLLRDKTMAAAPATVA